MAALCGRCTAQYPACLRVALGTCDQLATTFSAGFMQIQADCATAATCADVASGSFAECSDGKQSELHPTTAHTKLAADYCTTCQAGTASACESTYYDKQGSGGTFLMYSDAVIGQIDTTCIPPAAAAGADAGSNACESTFSQCAFAALQAANPAHNACSRDGG
jgi:hypothetical protein